MNLDLVYSRPTKTAAQLAEQAVDSHRFLNKRVLLTGDPEIKACEEDHRTISRADGLPASGLAGDAPSRNYAVTSGEGVEPPTGIRR